MVSKQLLISLLCPRLWRAFPAEEAKGIVIKGFKNFKVYKGLKKRSKVKK